MSEHAGRALWVRSKAAGGLRRSRRSACTRRRRRAAAPDPRVDELLAAQAALQRQVDELRQAAEHERRLGTTAHERAACWPQRLEELRASEAWARAYAEPEPLVTVRIATWNRAELLVERALASLRAQGYERWQAIVVGDACTDDTAERLAALGDPRVRFINLPLQGPYPDDPHERWLVAGIPPMNLGARLAEGTWIAPLDDDDEWEPDHLEVLLAAARREEAELAYGRLRGVHHDPPVTIEIGHLAAADRRLRVPGGDLQRRAARLRVRPRVPARGRARRLEPGAPHVGGRRALHVRRPRRRDLARAARARGVVPDARGGRLNAASNRRRQPRGSR